MVFDSNSRPRGDFSDCCWENRVLAIQIEEFHLLPFLQILNYLEHRQASHLLKATVAHAIKLS